MATETTFRIIEVALQIILVVFAGMALFAWKREIRGKDKYKLARALLDYAKDVRFLIYLKNGSLHQIYLNDILVNRDEFYNDRLFLIANEPVYFDQSIWGLFNHVNTRSDVFLPANIRTALDELCPHWGKCISNDKREHSYIQLQGVDASKTIESEKGFEDGIYEMFPDKTPTIKEYFELWENLVLALRKLA